MRFVTSAAAGLAAMLPRALARRSGGRAGSGLARRALGASRCVAALLALGLGLNGLGLCLCAPSTVKTDDPHACCPRSADHAGMPATGSCIKGSSAPCCTSHSAPAFIASNGDRDVLRHTPVAVPVTGPSPEGLIAGSVIGWSATSIRSSSPPRTTILRI